MKLNLQKPLVIFDLETTGLDLVKDRVIQLSYIKVYPDGKEVRGDELINPEKTIDRHLDTLSKWEYRWSDLSTRVADVSRFIYNYADGLADRNGDLSQQERDQVRQAMLDDWKQWSSKTVTLANSIRLKNNAAQPDSFPWHENKRPSTDL